MSHNEDVIPDSTYPQLVAPVEFKSQIPLHLLKEASDAETYIMGELSVGAQYNRWLVNALVEAHGLVRMTNGRLRRAEEDIKDLKADRKTVKIGWKVVSGIVGGVVAVVTFVIMVYQALRGS